MVVVQYTPTEYELPHYSTPLGVAKRGDVRVCLSSLRVCLFLCVREYISKTTHPIFDRTPILEAVVQPSSGGVAIKTYFRFYGRRHACDGSVAEWLACLTQAQ